MQISSSTDIKTLAAHDLLKRIDTKTSSKIARVLEYLLKDGSLNRFEAEQLGDHCLNSTISTLANSHGLTIKRTQEKVPTNWGCNCDVTRYELPPSEKLKAVAVLRMLSLKRKSADT